MKKLSYNNKEKHDNIHDRSQNNTDGQSDVEHAWHASQDGSVYVLGAVSSTHDHHPTVGVGDETVPETHELSLHHRCRFVVRRIPRPQERICDSG